MHDPCVDTFLAVTFSYHYVTRMEESVPKCRSSACCTDT